MPTAKFLKDPLFWLFIILVLGAVFLIGNINVGSIKAQTPVFGDGTGHYLAKWTGAYVPLPGNFTLTQGAIACNSIPLSWTASSDAASYRILRGSPRVDISPYQPYTARNFADTTVSQNNSYIYQIEAYNSSGSTRSNAITINTPYCPPSISFSANPSTIYQGQKTTLTWSAANATSCTASGNWSGSKATNGTEQNMPTVPPSASFTLSCTGPGGSASQSVNVSIIPVPDWKEVIPR